MTTRSPTAWLFTASYLFDVPIVSWPRTSPHGLKGPSTSYRCRSDPQIPWW